ncbi:hypothetical protein D3C81_2331520 [compost metagenome]
MHPGQKAGAESVARSDRIDDLLHRKIRDARQLSILQYVSLMVAAFDDFYTR